MDAEKTEARELFIKCGIDARRADETLKNPVLLEALSSVLKKALSIEGCDMKNVVNHLYSVASTLPASASVHRNTLVDYIVSNKIGKLNIMQSIAYLKKLGSDPPNATDFEKECGVGVVVTKEEVRSTVDGMIKEKRDEIVEQRYRYPIGQFYGVVKDVLKWANPQDIKEEVDAKILELLGPKTADDNAKPAKKAADPKKENKKEEVKKENEINLVVRFPEPNENKQVTPDLLQKHLKETGGKVICRFPPEPNGYLHIGHAKSMNLNFSYPKKTGGYTILRYDDTNPEAEKLEYIESIQNDVKWMGHSPAQINYSSDYFTRLYELAIELIKADKAYVDHQTPDEMADYREKRMDSPYRNRPIEESLRLFEDMKNGKFEEGKATLRMKMNMQSDNTVMRDMVAYRVKFTPHPHSGDKWVVYPTYDYTHCLVDSLENITHSLCTLEFLPRRESYYWLIDALGLYKPLVWEYSRLNITNVVLSKRKLIKLVNDGIVKGWNDPRMPTISGLRRRGYTSKSINHFCDLVGVTTSNNIIDMNLLEHCLREDLDVIASRVMVVLDPLKVTITNMEGGDIKDAIVAQNHPKDSSRGTRMVPFTKVVYIERSDFRMEDVKGYKRLALNKEVGLNHVGCAIKCNKAHTDAAGNVTELEATVDWHPSKKQVQGYIHWVCEPAPGMEPMSIEVRMYDRLFMSKDPQSLGDKWMEDVNPNSVKVLKCFAEPSLRDAHIGEQRQFERTGFFCVDPDTTPEKMVWNRSVTLTEAKWEGKADA